MTATEEKLAQFLSELTEYFKSHQGQPLSEEEAHWVRLAIQREAQAIAFRKAIIEKTLGGLIWSMIVGIGYVTLDFLRNHGLKI